MNEVFSYHSFVLPFIWNVEGIDQKSISDFQKCFEENPNWICTDLEEEHRINYNADIMSDDDAYLLYAEYQYFNPAARRAIYGFGSGIVKNYCFNPELLRNKGRYIIEKGGVKYTLSINGIRLKIYNTGVALFILECENPRGEEFKHQNNIAAVKNINDFGRRIALPFIPRKDQGYFSICADKLTLDISGVGTFTAENDRLAKRIESRDDIFNNISLTHICDFVKKILEFGGEYRFSTNPKKARSEKNMFYIYPALDDRMFVVSIINDKDIAQRYTAKGGDGQYAFESDEKLSADLYELVFVDPANECTCPDVKMRNGLLESHIYRRWMPYGSVYGIAAQSLICVTDHPNTINSVLTQYCQMAYLGLVQRASIINFQREVTTLSQSIEKQGKSIKTATIAKVLDLQERFVAFQNQLSFSEVSSQEQAIEIYNMLTEAFFIEKERDTLGLQLESLYAAANTNLDFSLNKGGTVIAVIALIMSSVSFLADLIPVVKYLLGIDRSELPIDRFVPVMLSLGAVAALLTFIILRVYRRRK